MALECFALEMLNPILPGIEQQASVQTGTATIYLQDGEYRAAARLPAA